MTGPRPVVIATQTFGEGASLANKAERFVEAVGERHCPHLPEPPIFTAHHLGIDIDGGAAATGRVAVVVLVGGRVE